MSGQPDTVMISLAQLLATATDRPPGYVQAMQAAATPAQPPAGAEGAWLIIERATLEDLRRRFGCPTCGG